MYMLTARLPGCICKLMATLHHCTCEFARFCVRMSVCVCVCMRACVRARESVCVISLYVRM